MDPDHKPRKEGPPSCDNADLDFQAVGPALRATRHSEAVSTET